MNKNGVIRNLVESEVQKADGNTYVGYEKAGNKVEQLLESGKVTTRDFSFRQLYEELVDVPLGADSAQVAEALNSSSFPTVASKVINKDIIDEYNLALGDVGNLVRESDATRTDEELVVGFTAGDTTPLIRRQGMAYEETSMGEKSWKIIMADFGRMISLTREVIFEDRTGEVLKRARDIGRAGGHHKQRMIVETIEASARSAFEESSFGGANYKGSDITLYSNDHSSLDGQTNDNLVASNALVDYTDLEAVYLAFAAMVDEAGDKISIVPNTMLVPQALMATASKIMNSQFLHDGSSNSNVPSYNPVHDIASGSTMDIVSSVFLSSASTWFMGDFSNQLLGLNVYAPATASQGADSELAFTNQIVARFRWSYHYGLGHTDWRYIIKSTA